MSSLKEAFEEFGELDDILYDIDNKEDIEKLKKSLDSDDDDLDNLEMIVDINAEDEEDLQDSYVGELLLLCPSCHTIHYAKKEDIIEDEENPEYVNVGEQCPHCDATEGFEIVGEVAPYNANETEETEPEDDVEIEDEFDLTDEDDLEDEENFKESLKSGKQKSFLERLLDNDFTGSNIDENGRPLELEGDDDTIEEKVGSVLPRVKKQVKENKTTKTTKKSLKESKLVEKPVYGLNPRYDSRKSFYGKAQVDTGDKGDKNKLYSYDTLVAEIKDGKPVVYGTYSQTTLRHIKDWLLQNGFKADSKAQIEKDYMTEGCDESMSYGELTDYQNAWEEYKKKVGYVYNGDASAAYDFIDEYVKAHPEYDNDEDRDAMFTGISAIEEPLKESKSLKESAQDVYADILDRAKMNVDEGYDVDEAIWDAIDNGLIYTADEFEIVKSLFNVDELYTESGEPISTIIMEEIYNEIYGEVSDYFDKKSGEVEESLEESKKDWVRVKQDGNWYIVDDSNGKEIDGPFETLKQTEDVGYGNLPYIAPRSDENLATTKRTVEQIKESIKTKLDKSLKESVSKEDDIDAKADDKKEIAKEKEEKAIDDADSDKDYEKDELDESLFDNLINKYCQRVYENVKDYKTTNGYTQDHKLVLEGLLTYKSGKTTNTKFIFEKKMTKDNKVKYVGLNETFSKSKRAFSLNCNIKDNKILSESLTYNYKVKVNDDRKVVYGSIKNN